MDPQRRPAWSPFFNAGCAVAAHSRPTLYGIARTVMNFQPTVFVGARGIGARHCSFLWGAAGSRVRVGARAGLKQMGVAGSSMQRVAVRELDREAMPPVAVQHSSRWGRSGARPWLALTPTASYNWSPKLDAFGPTWLQR